MESICSRPRFVTIRLPRGAALTPGGVGVLLRYAQRRAGAEAWGGAVAEALCARSGTLLLVRPAVTASVAPYALPLIHKYFIV